MATKITPEISQFISENYLKISRTAIAKKFGFSRDVLKTFYKNNNLIVPVDIIKIFRSKGLTDRTTFSEQENQFIRDNYLTMPIKKMEQHLQRSSCGIIGRMKKMGLIIPEEIIQQRIKDSLFIKGQVAFNKGKKQVSFMSPEAIERTKKTRFKKGQTPANAIPDGKEVLRIDKRRKKVYTLIKVPGTRKLKYKQIHVWEMHHKKELLPGHNIVFIDGNTQNFEPENLECITNEELMRRNTIQRYPEDLKKSMRKLGKLKRIIKKTEK